MNTQPAKFKKYFSTFSVIALSVALFAQSAFAFLDVRSNAYYYDAVQFGVERGLIDDATYFRPTELINRAEAAKILTNEFSLTVDGQMKEFVDVRSSAWYFPFVQAVSSNNVMTGYTNSLGMSTGVFGPARNLTRAEAAKIIVESENYPYSSCQKRFDDVDYSAWYGNYIDTACAFGVFNGEASGDTTYRGRPGEPINRAEFMTMIFNARKDIFMEEDEMDDLEGEVENDLEELPEDEEELEEEEQANDLPTIETELEARFNNYAVTQASATNCPNALCAPYVAQFELKPYIDDIHLKKLVFRNDDNTADFSSRFGTFYLIHEGRVIGTASMTDTGDDAYISFNNIDRVLAEDVSHDLSVLAEIKDVNRAADSGVYLKLYFDGSVDSIKALSNSNGNDISSGSLVNSAGPTSDRIQEHVIRKSYPTISYRNTEINTELFGSLNNYPVYKFTMDAHPNGDIEWKRMTFNVAESAGLESDNYKLYIEGTNTVLNSGANISSGQVVIEPTNPVNVEAGEAVTYVLKADISITNMSQSQTLAVELTAESDTTIQTTTQSNLSAADFLWSDLSALSHSAASNDWMTGYNIEAFDINTVNLGFQGN